MEPMSQPQAPVEQVAPSAQTVEPVVGNGTPVYAGFWRRFGAVIIDSIVLFAAGAIIGIVGVMISSGPQLTPAMEGTLNLISIALFLAYYSLMESSEAQATLGKKAFGIKVTDIGGNKISFGRALGRTALKYISALILMIGYIMAAFTQKKQALHDIIAGTLVVKK